MEIYFDNSATTRCLDEVTELMEKVMKEDYGNPSSMHLKGMQAENYIKEARGQIAKTLRVLPKEILFTSGGTESINLALIGGAMANQRRGRHLVTTRIEHPAVLNTMAFLEEQDFKVTYLEVDPYGRIDVQQLEAALTKETILVSMMHVNNEIGSLLPIEEAGRRIKEYNAEIIFHVDAIQSYGKFQLFPKKYGIDLLTVSGHKIHGPKGSGFLYIQEKTKVKPLLYGGGQQNNLRSGTENVPGIAGLGEACKKAYADFRITTEKLYQLKEQFCTAINQIEFTHINGKSGRESAPHIVSVSVEGVRSEVLLHALEEKGIYVSAGSACAANKTSPSNTLKQIGLHDQGRGTVRFSFSKFNTAKEVSFCIESLTQLIPMLRKYSRK